MALNFLRIFNGLNIKPKTTSTAASAGDIDFDTTANKLNLNNGSSSSPLVTEAHAATLTNKTIDADQNTITNIENADIKAGANIDRTKLASGTAYRIIANDASGVLSDAAAITPARALISDANGIPTQSVVTATELASLSGATGQALSQTNTVSGITNKTFVDASTLIQDDADGTKQFKFEASGITTGTTRTLTVPDLNDTLVVRTSTDTLSNKTLDNSTVLTVKDSNLTIQDNSDTTKQLKLELSGITTATTRTLTAPDADTTIVGTDATQALSNKDIDGGTASNTHRITIPQNTLSNLNSLTRKEGTLVYASDVDALYVDDGTQLNQVGGLTNVTASIANNQTSPANISGFLLNSSSNKAFTSNYSIVRRNTGASSPITEDTTFDTALGTAFNNNVFGAAYQSNGKLVVIGQFTSFNGTAVPGIARINTDGSLDTGFLAQSGTGFSGSPQVICIQPDDKILVGGTVTAYNGTSVPRFVRINANGSIDSSFVSNIGTGVTIGSTAGGISLLSDNSIIVAGNFASFNGSSAGYIIKLNSDGTNNSAFLSNAGTGFSSSTNGLAVNSLDQIIVGSTVSYNGTSTPGVAMLNSDGTLNTTFNSNIGTGTASSIGQIAIDSNDNIFLTGSLTLFNGNSVGRLVKLSATGVFNSTFNTNIGSGASGTTQSIAVDGTDTVFVGGFFTTFNGNSRVRAVRLNNDGTENSDFVTALGSGFDNAPFDIAIDPATNSTVFGGLFNTFNGNTRNRLVKFTETVSTNELMEVGTFSGVYSVANSTWTLIGETYSGSSAGVSFSMNSSGQLQYTSSNLSGTSLESTAKFSLIRL